MQVQVRLFSILRECLPPGAMRNRAAVELPEGARLTELITHLGIDRRLGYAAADLSDKAGWQVLINGNYEADLQRILRDGDQVQIFPPVAGGSEGEWKP
jgi:molybdopterin converting factor small subunit